MLFLDILYLFVFLVSLPWWIRYFFRKHYRDIFWHRFRPSLPLPEGKRFWIHAVSVGEVRSLRRLILQLREAYPGREMVLTVTTPSGYDCACKEYQGIEKITVIPAPFDFSFVIRSFIKRIDPQILILNELEIWPNWVSMIQRKKIPILLINGRISQSAFKRYRRVAFLVKPLFNKIQRFLVQAELYRSRFQELGIPAGKIRVCGNIKADEAFNSRDGLQDKEEIYGHLGIQPNGRKILVLASSHSQDEQMLVPVIPGLCQDFSFIIVPRHLDRVQEVEKMLYRYQVPYVTWSRQVKNSENRPISLSPAAHCSTMIYDGMGYLFNILKISDIVMMGGTQDASTGGHNLYEPAVLGKKIIGGPFFNNFPDIGNDLLDRGVYTIVRDGGECRERLNQWVRDDNDQKGTGTNADKEIPGEMYELENQAIEAVQSRRGSIQCILSEIQHFIT